MSKRNDARSKPILKKAKKPGGRAGTGLEKKRPSTNCAVRTGSREVSNALAHAFAPIERVRPRPRALRLIQQVACPDEIVRRDNIVGGIRDDRTPAVSPHLRLHCSHESQL